MTVTIGSALAEAQRKIDVVDARVLLRHAVARDAAYLAANPGAILSEPEWRAFDALVARRAAGEPVAYLTGEREFFSLDFRVAPAVLIPRPETELLVELALERIPADTPCRILDLGTGSGCVAVSIGKHRPRAWVTATDSSADALEIAAENARALGVPNIEFRSGDWFGAVGGGRFDVIVSNPPYIAEGDPHLRQGDLVFEPRYALLAGADGLDGIRKIVHDAGEHLAAGGWLMFEHGYDQAGRCRALLRSAGLVAVFSHRDLAGIERVSGGCKSRA